jgi:hypothetical protein
MDVGASGGTTQSYAPSGAYSDLLKTEHPFPVEIDLDDLL